jgi:hypothetical protein
MCQRDAQAVRQVAPTVLFEQIPRHLSGKTTTPNKLRSFRRIMTSATGRTSGWKAASVLTIQ